LKRNIFFELFSGYLDEKITSAGSKRERNKKQNETVRRADNLFNLFTAWPPLRSS